MHPVSELLEHVTTRQAERRQARAATAKRFAPDFNIVDMFGPDETKLSGLFRWLLDETGNHEQGGLFRDRFVADILLDDPGQWQGATVSCEVSSSDGSGRVDLLLLSQNGARCVVIENKPWAAWQRGQLSRYLADHQARGREVRVHALIGHGDPAGSLAQHLSEQPVPTGHFPIAASGFDKVVAWLETCAELAQADKVRSFIGDLADYCRRSVLREAAMTEENDTAGLILANEHGLRAAKAIAAALPLARSKYVEQRLVGARVEVVAGQAIILVPIDGIYLRFVLFGQNNPFVGVNHLADVPRMRGAICWDKFEKRWPRSIKVAQAGTEGLMLHAAVLNDDVEEVARLVPAVARIVMGSEATA